MAMENEKIPKKKAFTESDSSTTKTTHGVIETRTREAND